jgi:hypothetical protein
MIVLTVITPTRGTTVPLLFVVADRDTDEMRHRIR